MAERVIAGKYKLIAPIGRGGMAAVYRAQQTSDGKLVALKLLNLEEGAAAPDRDDVPDDTRELIERFEREARAASSMDTEHIVQVYDAGVDEVTGVPYIAMELLEGRDLNQLLHKLGVLAPEVAVRLVGQALTGLAQAHGAGIVHRDLKPANLFVDDSAFGQVKVKIVDFGIAKVQKAPIATLATVETGGLTQTGSVLGTPRYMSPEQIERPRSVNARSDVWSMGVVLYKCLTGRCPHDDAETLGAMLMALMTKPSPPIRSIAPWISPELSLVVHRALERDPSLRYASASAMLDALRPLAPKGFGLRDRELVALDDERKAQLRSLAPAMPSMTNEGAATIDQHGGLPALAKAGASGASAPVASESAPVPPVPPVPPTRARRSPSESLGKKMAALLASFRAAALRPFHAPAKPNARPRSRQKAADRLLHALPGITALLTFVALAGGGWAALRATALPVPKSEAAPADTFSAARAAEVLAAIAGDAVPRPAGSAESLRVHDLLLARLAALGYAPVEQNALACRPGLGCMYVRNVLARTRAPDAAGMTLLVAHYDSVPAGPGAGDDGSGVAIALEIARTLAAAPLAAGARAVGFLFDDGEESGLFGAQAFVDQHAWMKDVRSLVNLEARGTSGDSYLFEVIGDSDAVSRAAASALVRPSTSSLMATIYGHMPNSTDLTVFRRHGGVTGANLAFLDGVTRYHTARDTVDAVDRGSLQAQGDNALALVRAFADPAFSPSVSSASSAGGAGEGNTSTWFDLLHGSIVRAGIEVTWVVAALALLVSLVGLGRVKPSLSAVVRALFGLLLGPLLAGGLATVLLALARELGLPPATFLADPRFLLAAFLGVAVASLALAGGLTRYVHDASTEVASQVGWILLAALGAAAAYFAPGTAYLFALPALTAGLVRVALPRSAHLPEVAAALVLALLATSIVALLPMALGFDLAAALAVPPVLLLLPFAPLLSGIARPVALLGVAAMVAGLVMALRTPAFTASAPERVNVIFTRDPGRAAATIGVDAAWGGRPWGPVPEEMRAALGPNAAPAALLPWDRHTALRVDSDALPPPRGGAAPPSLPEGLAGAVRVEVPDAGDGGRIGDDLAPRPTKTGRAVRLHLTPPPGARAIGITFAEPSAVHAATLEGKDWPAAERGAEDTQFRVFLLQAPGDEARSKGLDVVLAIDGAEVVEGRVFAVKSGVPAIARPVVDARPASASPTQDGDSTWTWTSHRF